MLIEWLKGLLLTALIFVPLERLLILYGDQKVLRRKWLGDLICYQIINGQEELSASYVGQLFYPVRKKS